MLPGHLAWWIFSPIAKLNDTPLFKLTWMIKFDFPLPHPPSFSLVLLQFPPRLPCQVLPAVTPRQSTAQAQVLPESWMVNPAVWGRPCFSAPLEAALWAVQPSSAGQRWGISWALPLPSTPGWLRPSQLALRPAWAEPDCPWLATGSRCLLPALRGCLCLARPWFPKGTHQTPEPRGLLEQSRESAWQKLPSLSPRQGHIF